MLTPMEIRFREGTTRYVQITCKDQDGSDFDFDGYEVQTYLYMGKEMYLPTAKVGNMLSFKIPAEVSVGQLSGRSETRIFKGDDVASVIEIKYDIVPSPKPNTHPAEVEE